MQVHIADVAQYVTPGTALDLEARLRGTSVYFPDRAVPMLPQELSSDICSLRPGEDRLVLSCIMMIDADGEIRSYEVTQGVIRSACRMTYTQVHAIISGDRHDAGAVRSRWYPNSNACMNWRACCTGSASVAGPLTSICRSR